MAATRTTQVLTSRTDGTDQGAGPEGGKHQKVDHTLRQAETRLQPESVGQ